MSDTVTIRRTPDEPGDVAGAREVASILGIPRPHVARLRKRGELPEPFATTAATPLWLRSEIEELRDRRARAATEGEPEAAAA